MTKVKRNTTLRLKKAMCNQGAKKVNFVTTFDPSFPHIAKAIRKFSNLLSDGEECKRFSLKDDSELSTDEVTKISKSFLHHLELTIFTSR